MACDAFFELSDEAFFLAWHFPANPRLDHRLHHNFDSQPYSPCCHEALILYCNFCFAVDRDIPSTANYNH